MKTDLNKIERLFIDKSWNWKRMQTGTLLFSKNTTLEIIEVCRKKLIPLFIVEGFIVGLDIQASDVTENSVQPSMEHSIDFSQDPYNFENFTSNEIYDKAIEFVESRPEHIHFEIVCGEEGN